MTSPRRFEQDVPALLAALYLAGTPDYRDDLVRQVARTPQRPAWTFPGRWLPMEIVTTRVQTTRLPMRQLGVLALIAILIAAALAAYIGSQQVRLPAPYGPARNGLIAYAADGDIFTADPASGMTTAVFASPESDVGPRFSRDGTRLVFEREVGGDRSELYVVRPDGSELKLVTAEPVALTEAELGEPWEQYLFSPDGDSILIAEGGGISIAQSDGSGIRQLPIGMYATEPSFRPPDGREVLFVGKVGEGDGLFIVDVSTGQVRAIREASALYGLAGANWSPDGTRIAYWAWGGEGYDGGINAQTRIIRADGTGDREIPFPETAVWNAGSEWSNDGTRVVIVRGYTAGFEDTRLVVSPVDDSSPGREIPINGTVNAECCARFEWSPDDRSLLVTPAGLGGRPLPQVIIDVDDGSSRPAPWGSTSDPTWQRLAP